MVIALLENLGSDFYNTRIRYALYLTSLGYNVYAVVPDAGYLNKIKSCGIKIIPTSNNIRGSGKLNKLKYAFELMRIFRTYNFDIVHTYKLQPNIIGTFIAGTFTKSKIVNHITGLGNAFNHHTFKYKILQFITIILYKINDFLFQPLFVFQNHYDNKDILLSKRVFCVKGSSVNEDRFNCETVSLHKKRNIIHKFNILEGDIITFLFVSRLLKDKGIVELIEGFKLASKKNKIQLLIVGWFDVFNNSSLNQISLQKLIQGFDNIKFLGKQHDIPEIISLSDISILPTFYREGTPRFLLESMAMKKPIITTRMPGCDHLILKNKNGLLIQPKSVQSIENNINRICKMNFNHMGKLSYHLYHAQFSEKIVFSSLLNIYKK